MTKIKLSEVKTKCRCKVVSFACNRMCEAKLHHLGLTKGEEVYVTDGSYFGACTLKVKDSSVSIGHSMASQIEVEPVTEQ